MFQGRFREVPESLRIVSDDLNRGVSGDLGDFKGSQRVSEVFQRVSKRFQGVSGTVQGVQRGVRECYEVSGDIRVILGVSEGLQEVSVACQEGYMRS